MFTKAVHVAVVGQDEGPTSARNVLLADDDRRAVRLDDFDSALQRFAQSAQLEDVQTRGRLRIQSCQQIKEDSKVQK